MAEGEDKSKVDPYGFERPEDFDYNSYEEFMSGYLSVLARRASKWQTLLGEKSAVEHNRKVKRYIRKGIPAEHRAQMWMQISGAEARMKQNPDLYQKLLSGPKDQQLVETIKLDIHRTFPDNIYFQDTPSDPNAKRKPLFNVLVAFSHNNKRAGYCQGLNFITGLMLLIIKEEQKVFWLLDTLVNNILPDYYNSDMVAVKADQEVLGELIKMKVPDVHDLLERAGACWSILCTKWFICLYADVLPVETVFRIWDCLLYEGPKIIFRVAVALVKLNRQRIMSCKNFPEIVNLFKTLPGDTIVVHCHEFMQSIFTEPGSFSHTLIEKSREKCVAKVKAEG